MTSTDSGSRRPFGSGDRVHTVHRSAAFIAGTGLGAFGVAGFLLAGQSGAGSGAVVLGLFTNAVLSALSVAVGALLLAAAVRGGPAASTTLLVLGPLFLVSGIGNACVIGTPLDMLSFQAGDIIFSLIAGAVLLLLGAYGRFTGGLPTENPYARRRRLADPLGSTSGAAEDVPVRSDDVTGASATALADAERAVSRHTATTVQVRGVLAAGAHRSHRGRLAAFDRAVTS